jgi:hypothetical protein
VPLVDVDVEGNVPTVFSALLLAACALSAHLRARESTRTKLRRGWTLTSALLAIAAVDELACMHERLAATLLATPLLRATPSIVWAIGAALVVALAMVLAPFLRALDPRMRVGVVAAAVVFVTGALGIEAQSHAWARVHGYANATYASAAALEEFLEMTGAMIFLVQTTRPDL